MSVMQGAAENSGPISRGTVGRLGLPDGVRRGGGRQPFLLDALEKQAPIRYIACRLETTAALMASAEAKLTGRLAVCTATAGPGAALLWPGWGMPRWIGLRFWRSPDRWIGEKIGTGAKQAVDQQLLVQPFARFTALTADSGATAGAAQPGHADGVGGRRCCPSVGSQGCVDATGGFPDLSSAAEAKPPRPAGEAMEKAIRAMEERQRPIILAGRGAEESRDELLALCGSAVSSGHDYDAGATGCSRGPSPVPGGAWSGGKRNRLRSAPAIRPLYGPGCHLVAGGFCSEGNPRGTGGYFPGPIGLSMPVMAGVVGELREVLEAWIDGIQPRDRSVWRGRIERPRVRWKEQIEKEARQNQTPLAPQRVIAALGNAVEDDAIIALDTGDHTLWFNRIFQPKSQEILLSGRWRTLGFGLPAAMAAKRIYDDRQVVALVGDGGLVTTMADLITAVRYGWPITVIVMNNGSFAMEKNRMETAGLDPASAEAGQSRFCCPGGSFGGEGYFVEDCRPAGARFPSGALLRSAFPRRCSHRCAGGTPYPPVATGKGNLKKNNPLKLLQFSSESHMKLTSNKLNVNLDMPVAVTVITCCAKWA